jgi:hypothetical protein
MLLHTYRSEPTPIIIVETRQYIILESFMFLLGTRPVLHELPIIEGDRCWMSDGGGKFIQLDAEQSGRR